MSDDDDLIDADLDTLLDGDPETPPEPAEPPADKADDEPAPKGDEPAEPPSVPDESTQVPIAALQDERRKRQELEQRLAALEDAPEPEVDTRSDLERATAYTDQRFVLATRAMVAAEKPDFSEKETKFLEMAKANPNLAQQMLAADNPALFAYQTAAKQIELDSFEGVDNLREKIRAEVLAELKKSEGIPSDPSLASMPSTTDVPTDDDLSAVCLGD